MVKSDEEGDSPMNQTELSYELPQPKKQEVIEKVLPQLRQIFGEHIVRIVSFDHDELSYVNLAVLLKDYSTELYKNDMPAVHAVTESINENVCLLSVIAIDNDTLKNHVLFPEINAGTEIYRA